MKQELNNIVRSIFGKDSLEDVSRDELVLLSGEYPYSPVVQYLFTRKLQQMGDPRFADSVSRTALYFSNPHWLHHQLRGKSNAEKIAEMEEQFVVVPEEATAAAIEPETEWIATPQEEISEGAADNDDDMALIIPDEAAIEPETEWIATPQEEISEGAADNDDDMALTVPEAAGAVTEPEAPAETTSIAIEPETLLAASIESSETTELTTQDPYEGGYESIAFEQSTEAICDPLSGGTNDGEISGYTHEPDAGTVDLTGFEAEDEFADMPEMTTHSPTPREESLLSRTEEAVTGDDDSVSERHTEALEMPADLAKTDAREASGQDALKVDELGDLVFEPMHSVDYFASQGIGLGEEAKSEALVKPLRSFTGWIRSMKQIQPAKQKQMLDEQSEHIIRSKAEFSNETEIVLTEAMALVYEKQGMVKKALDILEKLSLLDPAKKDIFAAKIQELKGKSI